MVISIDRALHWTILIATAWLPRKMRVRLRYRWLKRLQVRLLERADLVMIRHPKTGGTWLRAMLTHLYAHHYGISERRVFKSDELQRQDRRLPRWAITNGMASWEKVVAECFAEGSPLIAGRKFLFVARHPGDIVVSWYIQYTRRTKAFKRELLEAELTVPIDRDTVDRWEFIQHPELGLPWLIRYHNFWAEQLKDRPDALIVRYEDLRLETETTLARIGEFIGESFTTEQIRAAVAFGSVDNMRKLEESNYFQNNSLKLRHPTDQNMRKVRRAQVGGYRQDLSPEQLAWVDEQVDSQLDPVFGYAGRDGQFSPAE